MPSDLKGSKKERYEELVAMLQSLSQLTEDQRNFALLVAYGETGGSWSPSAHNDTPSEVHASEKAWDNNASLASRLLNCGHGGRDAWCIGSGGYGGRLVPYFGDDMLDAGVPCQPDGVFQKNTSLISLLITAWKLQQVKSWQRSAHTVANLRVGFYGLGYMDNVPDERREKYIAHAKKAGLPEGFVDRELTDFPGPAQWATMLKILEARDA